MIVVADPAERLRQMGRANVSFAREEQALFRLMLGPTITQEVVQVPSSTAFDRLIVACAPLQPGTTLVQNAFDLRAPPGVDFTAWQ